MVFDMLPPPPARPGLPLSRMARWHSCSVTAERVRLQASAGATQPAVFIFAAPG